MRYNLGTFTPRPGSQYFDYLHRSDRFAGLITRGLEEMLRVRLSQAGNEDRMDLLHALGEEHSDRPWLEAVHGRMDQLHLHGLELRLLACDMQDGSDGFLTVAATAPALRLEVFPDDWMQVGFGAMREGDRVVQAWPRLFREVCQNGSLVCVEQLEPYVGTFGIDDAIERFLTTEFYEPAIQGFRQAREIAVRDPREYLDESMRMGPRFEESRRLRFAALMEDHYREIEARFEEEGDLSLYGLINAVTATARDLEDWRERFDLEELGGQLALLQPPVPRRSRGATLVPA